MARHGDAAGRPRRQQPRHANIYKEIGRIASKPVNVLIRGETGTGKELIARAIYQHSDRAKAPFIAVNCAAIPETLLESELFGHERGAFTGAELRRIGRFEQADRGTIFLDEIGDMTPGTQVKLMRVLQERSSNASAAKRPISVDVRVIAATHRDLEAAIAAKQFREDLYYRLSVVVITLPPLRERREDIPELVQYFLRKHAAEMGVRSPSIHADAVQFLQAQNWPGNVRELENVVRKVLLMAQGYTINVDHVRAASERRTAPTGRCGANVARTGRGVAGGRPTWRSKRRVRAAVAFRRKGTVQPGHRTGPRQSGASRSLGRRLAPDHARENSAIRPCIPIRKPTIKPSRTTAPNRSRQAARFGVELFSAC